MSKFHSTYVCQQCGYAQVNWSGKCPECGTWNSLVETVVSTGQESKRAGERKQSIAAKPVSLSSISEAILCFCRFQAPRP